MFLHWKSFSLSAYFPHLLVSWEKKESKKERKRAARKKTVCRGQNMTEVMKTESDSTDEANAKKRGWMGAERLEEGRPGLRRETTLGNRGLVNLSAPIHQIYLTLLF
jgi:hypothetical protein